MSLVDQKAPWPMTKGLLVFELKLGDHGIEDLKGEKQVCLRLSRSLDRSV